MIDSPKNTQLKRRKRAAELIGLFSQVTYRQSFKNIELKRRRDFGKHEKDDLHMPP